MRKILLLTLMLLLPTAMASGDTVTLKSGKVIQGRIVNQSSVYVRILTGDGIDMQEYLMDNVESISIGASLPEPNTVINEAPPEQVPEVSPEVDSEFVPEDEFPLEDQPATEVEIPDSDEVIQEEVLPTEEIPYIREQEPLQEPIVDVNQTTMSKELPVSIEVPANEVAPREIMPDEVYQNSMPSDADYVDDIPAVEEAVQEVRSTSPVGFQSEAQQWLAERAEMKKRMEEKEKSVTKRRKIRTVADVLNNESLVKLGLIPPPEPEITEEGNKLPISWQYLLIGAVVMVIGVLVFIKYKQQAVQPSEPVADGETSTDTEQTEAVQQEPMVLQEKNVYVGEKDEKEIVKRVQAASPLVEMLIRIPGLFIYPFRKNILWATLGGTVIFTIMHFAMYAPFYGFVIFLMFICYTIASMVSIIQGAVNSDDEITYDWPDFIDWFDWIGKFILFILSIIIIYGPPILYVVKISKQPDWFFFVLLIIGGFTYPMYVLSISLVGGLASLNVINIVKSIGYTFLSYFVMFLILGVIQTMNVFAYMIPLVHIPIWGKFIHWFIFVYFLFVTMRLLGIFYRVNRYHLGWFKEGE